MNPSDEKTLTIAQRTRKNLEYIYTKKAIGDDVEEFTQLLNSMLGMVISLRENYFKGSQVMWQKIEELGLLEKRQNLKVLVGKNATPKSPKLEKVNSFSQLFTKLRHAFSHNCFKLEINKNSNQIRGVTVWNIPQDLDNEPKNRIWEEYFSEVNLKDLAYLTVEYIEKEIG